MEWIMTCQDMTASLDVKDNLGMMSNSIKQQSMAILQVISFQQYPKNPYKVKDTTNYKSEKQTRNFCSLKMQTLQTFVVSKCGHYCTLPSPWYSHCSPGGIW